MLARLTPEESAQLGLATREHFAYCLSDDGLQTTMIGTDVDYGRMVIAALQADPTATVSILNTQLKFRMAGWPDFLLDPDREEETWHAE